MSYPRSPYIKGKNFDPFFIAKRGIPKEADSILNPKVIGTPRWEAYWQEIVYYCTHGYQTGGLFIPGRYFYYGNFNSMSTNTGVITPDMVDLHLELSYILDYCIANKKNLILAKKRRGGISEFFQKAKVDYDYRFNPGSQSGVASGLDTFAQEFMKKWRFGDALMPPELRLKMLKDNDKEIIAGYKFKNENGELVNGGSKSTIYVRTMNRDAALFKGLALSTIIGEECGEFEKLEDFYNDSKACLMQGSVQTGIFIFFGTGGNINKGSADFQKIWNNAEDYNFEKFLITAKRFHFPFYGGATPINGIKAQTPNLLEKFQPYQLIGVEDVDAAEKNILDNRAEALKSKNMKKYREELKNYPLTEADIFTSTVDNDFDIDILNDQQVQIDSNPKKYIACQLDYKKDPKTKEIKYPFELEVRVDNTVDEKGVCFLIHQDFLQQFKGWDSLFVGGCLLPGEKVMTDKGLMNIEDVTKKELLINEEGKYVRINELLRHDKIDEKVYTLKVSNTFRTTTFTSEHPILISKPSFHNDRKINRNGLKFDYIKVPEVEVNDWIKVPNIYRRPNDFDISEFWDSTGLHKKACIENNPLFDSDFWWFVGLWLGDGYCESQKGKISFSFNSSETEYVDRFTSVVKKLFNRNISFRIRQAKCIEASFTCQQLSLFLTKHFGKYAFGKKLPEWAKHINEECKKQLVLGYLDSDGCIALDRKRNLYNTQFISINLELLESFHDILLSLGHIPQICKLRNARQDFIQNRTVLSDIKEAYQLRLGNSDTINLVKSLWRDDDPKLRRVDFKNIKKTRSRAADGCFMDKSLDYIYFQVREITLGSYTGMVYNFNCETHTFMCHHITTHNCDSYDQDKAKSSKSLGAMCVTVRRNTIGGMMQMAPVATICCRPQRREIFYEMCFKLSIWFNLRGNTLIDVANKAIFDYYIQRGGEAYLAYRPKKFEGDKSEQTHTYGFHLNLHSKPLMVGFMQSMILDYGNHIWFPELIKQLRNYNVAMIGSDNDLADAYGISLVQDVSSEMKPRDTGALFKENPFVLPEWVDDGQGNMIRKERGNENAVKQLFSVERDHPRFGQK